MKKMDPSHSRKRRAARRQRVRAISQLLARATDEQQYQIEQFARSICPPQPPT